MLPRFSENTPYTNAHILSRLATLVYEDSQTFLNTVANWGFHKAEFFNQNSTEAGIVADDEKIIITFRGTQGFADVVTDIKIHLAGGPLGGMVHKGFQDALHTRDDSYKTLTVADEMHNFLQQLLEEEPINRPIYITGHSLGAALAKLFASELLARDIRPARVITFGEPRGRDTVEAQVYNKSLGHITERYVNNNDVVPRVPPPLGKIKFWSSNDGFAHTGTLYYINSQGQVGGALSKMELWIDRWRGRYDDFGRFGPDDFGDHKMANYEGIMRKLAEKEQAEGVTEALKMLAEDAAKFTKGLVMEVAPRAADLAHEKLSPGRKKVAASRAAEREAQEQQFVQTVQGDKTVAHAGENDEGAAGDAIDRVA